jgi:tetratricopeptide (TPR) repeat protein
LTADERNMAEALSHYTMGIVSEAEGGARSEAALKHFTEAASLDPSMRRLHYRAALSYMRRGEIDQAVAQLEASCRANPGSYEAWAELATICQLTDRIPAAVAAYEKAIGISPGRSFTYGKLAELHLQRGRDVEAFNTLRRGFQKADDPEAVAAVCRDYGGVRAGTNDTAGAIACFEFLAQNAPSRQPEYNYMAGLLYDSLSKTNKAATCYAAATRGTNAVPDAYVRLALHDSENNPRKAIETLERGRTVFPSTPEILFLLGTLYDTTGDDAKASEAFAQASKADPSVADSFVRLALMQVRHDPKKARETLETASRRMPNQAVVLYALAQFNFTEKRFPEAADLLARTVSLLKASGQTNFGERLYMSYGAACERAGRTNEAEVVLEECVRVHPKHAEALNYLAYMWAEQGTNLEKAAVYVGRALRIEPDNGAFVDTLGWILFKQQKYRQALEQLEVANLLEGDDPTILDHIGDTHKALGNTAKAVTFWKRSLVLDRSNAAVAAKLRAENVDVDALLSQPAPAKPPPEGK